ncbi:MAG: hypothetical protein ABIS51_02975 [Sphingomonas sp.]|jgi:hypothetical protein
MPRSTASVSVMLALLAVAATGSIALKGAMRSAPEQALADQAQRAIAARLAQQGFAVRIERHPVQNNVVLADRGACRISARDASPGAAFATAFTQQAASVGPVRYLYRQQQFAAPPDTRTMLFRLVPRTLDRLGLHLARPLPVAIATSSACPAGDFGLGDISVTP